MKEKKGIEKVDTDSTTEYLYGEPAFSHHRQDTCPYDTRKREKDLGFAWGLEEGAPL
jgi:hypothetical protein